MKKYTWIFGLAVTALMLGIASCSGPDDNNNDPSDDSPGIEEDFYTLKDGVAWHVDADSTIGAVVSNFGGGPVITLIATDAVVGDHFTFSIPYFYGSDTTYTIPVPANLFELRYTGTGAIYIEGSSGTITIHKHTHNGYEVYTGTFQYSAENIIDDNDIIQFTGGTFTVARLL